MKLDQVLNDKIGEFLKPLGFKKKNSTFYKIDDNNFGLVDIQKSKSSSKESILFTINLGVCSGAIRNYFDEYSALPEISECHWQKRIGFLLDQNNDHWWQIDSVSEIESLMENLIAVLKERALPEIDKNLSDNSLLDNWLKGISDGITELDRYINLTILLKIEKRDEELVKIAEEMRAFAKGKAFESTVRVHLKAIGL